MRRLRTTAVSLALALLMAGGVVGCGQKGPLYFPDDDDAPEPVIDPEEIGEDDE